MARSAVLVGRTLSDLIRNLFVIMLMIDVGFRRSGSWTAALGAFLLITLLGFALSWLHVFVGLAAPSAETAQAMRSW